MNRIFFILFFSAAAFSGFAQKLSKQDKKLISNLQQHVRFLADDKLEGRRTGTVGEKLAATYISDQFQKIGLAAKGPSGYLQPFEMVEGKQINPGTSFSINGTTLTLNKDYFPLAFSPNIEIAAAPSMALQEPGMPWFFDLHELLDQNASNPHFDIVTEIVNSAKGVHKRGGTAVIIYNTSEKTDGVRFDSRDKNSSPIPVIYVSKDVAQKYFSDPAATLDIKIRTDIGDKKRSGMNVVGHIDNGAASTIVLGAHYDHLGLGEDGNSREVEKKSQVHNGADDNASGIAALIELAKMIQSEKLRNSNYVFVAFSGEELGLFGSKHFTQHPTVDLASVNFMINMDMVGRLNDSSKVITIGGYGTSPSWGEIYGMKGKNALYSKGLNYRFDSSGTGPSDHTSFYLKNIPVLFYFTGLHSDYHKPSDDADKINYVGQLHVVRHIMSVLEATNRMNRKLSFTKTREMQTATTARFSVTLGIMPDYTYTGAGVRADGVSENRPAQKAGIRAGDIILSIGEYKVNSMETYMQTLGKFKKGEKTTVVYQRGKDTFSTTVEF